MATVTLAWVASPSTNVAGYKVHYGTAPGVYSTIVDAGNPAIKEKSILGLALNTTYYFAVGAYNSLGQESAMSNEVSANVVEPIPSPPTGLVVQGTSPTG